MADVDGDGLPDLYFVTQLGEQPALEEPGQRQVPQHHGRGRGRRLKDQISVAASFADVDNDGDPDLFVTTVRERQPPVPERRQGALQGRLQGGRASTTSATPRAAVFFDYDRDGLARPLRSPTSASTPPTQSGRGGYYVGLRGRLPGPPAPGAHRVQHPLPQPGQATASRTSRQGDGAARRRLERRRHRSATSTSDGWPDLYVLNMQGDNHYWENQGGKAVRRQDRPVLPQDLLGRDGDQGLRLRQRRPAWTS